MSQIELLMKELDLKPGTITSTLNKVKEICQYDQDAGKFCFMKLNGNGDGDN